MNPSIVRLAAFLGATAVAVGAFGAHWLRDRLSAGDLAIFQTGVQYQFWHALALLGLAALSRQLPRARQVAWCFGLGVLLFSGSLYALVLTQLRWLGAITPLGGTSFIIGWMLLGFSAKSAASE